MKRNELISKHLKEHDLDAFLSIKASNILYSSGFTGGEGIVIVFSSGRTILLVDGRYTYQAKTQAFSNVEVFEYQPKQLWDMISEYIQNAQFIGLEGETHLSLYLRLYDKFPEKSWKNTPDFFELIRMKKEENEINILQQAAYIANQSYLAMLNHVKQGISEAELSAILEFEMKKRGGQKVSFDTIVASGKRSAMPHGVASEKVIEHGDLITFDFGVFYQGYASDTTRTVAFGKPKDTEAEKIYRIVLDAQKKAIDGIQEGVLCSDIDMLARDYITQQGYGPYFKHSTGHGVGLEIHELPRISSDNKVPLLNGMVITVEPGIYLDERFGVRIEDSIVVLEKSYLNLSQLEKDKLLIL
jgi:Xaa-Pro aminopeptidase